ncbi:lysophospholipid acyltransferase family protein [Kaarinaea lacus]
MLFFRSLIFTGFMMVSVPFYALPGLLTLPFPFSIRYTYFSNWGTLIIWLLRLICNLKYEVSGQENIPKGAGIIFSKHQSSWETIALQRIFPPQVWVLKRELFYVPVFGWILALLGSVGIDRKSGRKAVQQIVDQGTQRLQQGRWIVVFPEGTRVAPGKRKRYGIGGAVLAEKSGYPVVPVAHNAGEFWPRRGLLKKPGVIKVVIGEPIETKGRSADEINKIAEHWIETTVEKISTLNNKSTNNE